MDILLDLREHCIVTELKKLLDNVSAQYYADSLENAELEERIECVQGALEQLDLPALRGQYPELAGGKPAEVILSCSAQDGLRLSINGSPVQLILKANP